MAYFSNGTEGEILDEQCFECLHSIDDFTIYCPIAAVQAEFNYRQCKNPELKAAMNFLIDEKGNCQMKPIIERFMSGKT